jgi:LacI family transcriptional regulator
MSTKRVTSTDVAEAAGVSRTTVSIVLNEVQTVQISDETRQRVIGAANRLGYVPNAAARALVSSRAQIVGLVLTRSPHHIASDGFLTQILDGLIETIRAKGMRLLIDIVEPQHQKEAYLQLVRAKHIDGIILSGPRYDDDALQALTMDGFPTVLMGQVPDQDYYSVDVNNFEASRMAVSHLIHLGHQRIACITNAPITYTAAEERLRGYQAALAAVQIPFDESLIRFGDFSLNSGYQQMSDLLIKTKGFTAAFVASDAVAVGAMAAMREQGLRIPEDIALVGFDDLPLAYYLDPPLTTLHVPAIDLARQACSMLIELLGDRQPAQRQVILDTHLVVRESCGAQSKKFATDLESIKVGI